jgi:hypothetical protein
MEGGDMRRQFRDAVLASIGATFLAIAGASTGHAFTLPAFSPDIAPTGLSVKITSTQVTPRFGPTSTNASFALDTPFSSIDFIDDVCFPASNAEFIVGAAPSQNCKTGEATLTPIMIPLGAFTNTDCETFAASIAGLVANMTISTLPPVSGTNTPPSYGGNQKVSCVNGVCTSSGGGTTIVTGNNQTIVNQSNSSSGQNPPTNALSFNATSTAPGTIVVPQSKVDVFILYTADNDADDSGSGYEGACVTLKSLSAVRVSKNVNGTETVTQSFSAH